MSLASFPGLVLLDFFSQLWRKIFHFFLTAVEKNLSPRLHDKIWEWPRNEANLSHAGAPT